MLDQLMNEFGQIGLLNTGPQFDQGTAADEDPTQALYTGAGSRAVYQNARARNYSRLMDAGVGGLDNVKTRIFPSYISAGEAMPDSANVMMPAGYDSPSKYFEGGTMPDRSNLASRIMNILQQTRDDKEFQAKYKAIYPELLQQYPGLKIPDNLTRDQMTQMVYSVLNQDQQWRAQFPELKHYDPNPPPTQEQLAQKEKLGILKDLIASDKSGSLKGMLPQLLQNAGLLGNGSGGGASNPYNAIYVQTGTDQGSMNPLEAYQKGLNPDTGKSYDAYSKDNLDRVKEVIDINDAMGGKPIGILSPGQTYFDSRGKALAYGGDASGDFGQPVAVVGADGKQHYAVTDKNGDVKMLDNIAPVPKAGTNLLVNDPSGNVISVNQGGDSGQYPTAFAPAGQGGTQQQYPNQPPAVIKNQMMAGGRGNQGSTFTNPQSGQVISSDTNRQTSLDQSAIASFERLKPQMDLIISNLPQFQTVGNRTMTKLQGYGNELGATNYYSPTARAQGEASLRIAVEGIMKTLNLPQTNESYDRVKEAISPMPGESPQYFKQRSENQLQQFYVDSLQAKNRLAKGIDVTPPGTTNEEDEDKPDNESNEKDPLGWFNQ